MRGDHGSSPEKVTTDPVTDIAAYRRRDTHAENAEQLPESSAEIDADHVEWRYHYHGKRGADVTFTGHVIPVGGTEGERLLHELGAVVRDLLEWAYNQSQSEQSQSEHAQRDVNDQDGEAA